MTKWRKENDDRNEGMWNYKALFGAGGSGKGEGGEGWAAEFLLYFYFFICFLSLPFMLYRETKYHYRPSGDVDTVACV